MVKTCKTKYLLAAKCLLAALLFLLLLIPMGGRAQASSPPVAEVTLHGEQTFQFTSRYDKIGNKRWAEYVFEAVDVDAPMPAGSVGNSLTLRLTANETFSIGPISYPIAGIYHYKIYRTIAPEDDGVVLLGYPMEYNITIYVKNTGRTIVIIEDREGRKYVVLGFNYVEWEETNTDYGRPEGPDITMQEKYPDLFGDKEGSAINPEEEAEDDDLGLGSIKDEAPVANDMPERSPQTGDESNLSLWVLLATLSTFGLLVCGWFALRLYRNGKEHQ